MLTEEQITKIIIETSECYVDFHGDYSSFINEFHKIIKQYKADVPCQA